MAEIPPSQYAAYPRRPEDPRQYYGPPEFRVNAINEAWLMYKADMGTWVLGFFLIIVLTVAVQFPASLYIMWKGSMAVPGTKIAASPDAMIVTFVFSALAAAVGGVLNAGYYRIALQRTRLIVEGVGGIFNLNGQGLALAVWSFLYGLPNLILAVAYNAAAPQPDFNQKMPDMAALFGPLILYFVAIVIVGLFIFPFILTPILMVDQRLSMGAAAKKSWQTVAPKYLPALGFYIAISFVAAAGVLACGIGAIFTLPLLPLTLAIVYRDFFIPPITNPPFAYPQEGPLS